MTTPLTREVLRRQCFRRVVDQDPLGSELDRSVIRGNQAETVLALSCDESVPAAAMTMVRSPLPVDKAYFTLAPDSACEVLSPSTAALDRGDKRGVSATEGVAHLWFVDPEARTLEVLELDGPSYRIQSVFSGEANIRAEPFDAIELDLAALWAR